MDVEVVSVGTELLLGFTLDTNASYISRALAPVGVRVTSRTTVADERPAIRRAVAEALDRSRFAIVTGGLGPTADDVTREAVAEELGLPLELDPGVLEAMEQRFATFRRGPMPPSNRRQAMVPRGATVLPNAGGTAPGLWIETARGVAVLLPGVPREMRALLTDAVIPRIAATVPAGEVVVSRTLRTTGVSESSLATALERVADQLGDVSLAFLPGVEGVDLRLTARGPAAQVEERLAAAHATLHPLLGDDVYGVEDEDLAGWVLTELRTRGERLAVAESCTGGLIGARLTAVPGASAVFVGGVVAYANDVKRRELDVSQATIDAYGAVSDEVVREMVEGVARRFGSEAAVAVTGIAGPAGGSAEKPVGTVWMAARYRSDIATLRRRLPGDRAEIRERAAQGALDLLRRLMSRRGT